MTFLETQLRISESISEIIDEFVDGEELNLFSNDFRHIVQKTLKENLTELSSDAWKRSIRFAFQKIDDTFLGVEGTSKGGITYDLRSDFRQEMVNTHYKIFYLNRNKRRQTYQLYLQLTNSPFLFFFVWGKHIHSVRSTHACRGYTKI